MQPGPGKPGHIPSCPVGQRQITPQITTKKCAGTRNKIVRAYYRDVREYKRIEDGPVYARWRPSGIFQGGGHTGTWLGEVVIESRACTNELDAIQDLLLNLAELQLPVEGDPGAVLAALRAADPAVTPWEQQPMGIRKGKPQRKHNRRKWTDTTDGSKHHIYQDTLRKHADPNCACKYCVTTPPEEEEDEDT